MKLFLPLPGLHGNTLHKYKLYSDFLYFLVVVAVPSSFFALIDQRMFYKEGFCDLNLIVFVLSLCYAVCYIKYIDNIRRLPGGGFLCVLVLYLLLQIMYSYFWQDIPLVEVFTVFRKNFIWPIVALGFLLYASSMDIYRINRFFRWLLVATFLQAILYIVSNITGIDFFGARVKDPEEFMGEVLLQNLSALPQYLSILFVFSFSTSFIDNTFKKYWYWVLPLIVVTISIVRSMLIVFILYIILIIFFIVFRRLKTNVVILSKHFVIITLAAVVTASIFHLYIARFIDKFELKSTYAFSDVVSSPTYDMRIRYIEEAYERTKKGNIILGHGYVRESEKGSRDFVLGGDTLIAPVIFTEGILGLILRWLPIFAILLVSLKELMASKKNAYRLYFGAIVVLILPEILSIIQTDIFTHYEILLFIVMLLQLIVKQDQRHVMAI